MSKLWLIGLAASAAWTPAATAAGAPPAPPPPPMAHGPHLPAPQAGGVSMHGGGHRMKPGMPGGHHRIKVPGFHGGKMQGWQRFGRGHVLPPHFRGRQFFVHNWQSFGWPAPMPGGQWIRYHDDALLIDRDGRVVDGRYGWDWEGRGGDRMAYEDERFDEDYYEDEDYAREEWDGERGRHHGDGDRTVRVYRHDGGGDCRRSCPGVRHLPPPPPHPGYGYGYGYGHGSGYGYGAYGYGAYGYGGPVVVTETITTTAPVVETHTYYETVTERRAAPRRHYRKPAVRYSKPAARRSVKAAPAPRPGERG